MTELEIMMHAKEYIDKMANGINPLTGEAVNENDIVNNVRISRCLFYVSGVLEKAIENGGQVGKKAPGPKRAKFFLPDGALEKFIFPGRDILISELAEKISELNPDENVRKLSAVTITKFLMEAGLLEEVTVNNKKRKRPTENGKDMGIYTEERVGQYGAYTAVLYSEKAQHFIIDNIYAIIEMNGGGEAPAGGREPPAGV